LLVKVQCAKHLCRAPYHCRAVLVCQAVHHQQVPACSVAIEIHILFNHSRTGIIAMLSSFGRGWLGSSESSNSTSSICRALNAAHEAPAGTGPRCNADTSTATPATQHLEDSCGGHSGLYLTGMAGSQAPGWVPYMCFWFHTRAAGVKLKNERKGGEGFWTWAPKAPRSARLGELLSWRLRRQLKSCIFHFRKQLKLTPDECCSHCDGPGRVIGAIRKVATAMLACTSRRQNL
jgi:hypothetical protein